MTTRTFPDPALIVLVGPGAAGKSTWAAAHFPADAIVSSDRLRALVGAGEDDIAASTDAFALLDTVVAQRIGRRLTTVVDTLGLDPKRRKSWLDAARQAKVPCIAVAFDIGADEARSRNRQRDKKIPAEALTAQLRSWRAVRATLDTEGFDEVLTPEPLRIVAKPFETATAAATRQATDPTVLKFGLHLGSYTFPGGAATTAGNLRDIARAAEDAGFDAVYVMDHFRQIPQIGRAWDDFLESYTTLAYLAAHTDRVRLGALVTGITYRNVGHLGKIVATLDVLSQGRAVCGLGLGWWAEEHAAYGWEFPSERERYVILEDAVVALRRLWGPGSKPFAGAKLALPDTSCYPRPLQDHIPIVIGGSGERKTLRLAAQYADAANVFGDLANVRHKREILVEHCRAVDRDPADVAMTHLSTVLVGADQAEVTGLVEKLRPRRWTPGRYAASVNAGTVADHIGRFRELGEAGASEVIVRVADLTDPAPLERIAHVINAFR
ncbi:TIGR03560 family F420-dependent LLM class oxidoreductase [Antrihabitans sp. YC2-6]|uniref:TIGR03560 family F420-dependent LLM class oxidoreductase n=1 Tax=Antrihabitans sp. YC2-6 TaxID=2799498 RepID=UPI0018F34051|nr:TIGR03560 family F420-dependent LLM class oxidoreductase [Antrihabitans sp. YC2-6]MBJ8348424.1 TIGR03560 family F420-dependent LLM class oxidoreductase [Antrihabitans sp. YC2-6]